MSHGCRTCVAALPLTRRRTVTSPSRLVPRPGLEQWLEAETVISLASLFGDLLGVHVAVGERQVNSGALPWRRDYRSADARTAALSEYAQRLGTVTDTIIDGCPQSLLATWSLAVEHAHELPPAGLSWPALVFASAFDTSGIPAAVLTSPTACAYVAGQHSMRHAAGTAGPGFKTRPALSLKFAITRPSYHAFSPGLIP